MNSFQPGFFGGSPWPGQQSPFSPPNHPSIQTETESSAGSRDFMLRDPLNRRRGANKEDTDLDDEPADKIKEILPKSSDRRTPEDNDESLNDPLQPKTPFDFAPFFFGGSPDSRVRSLTLLLLLLLLW